MRQVKNAATVGVNGKFQRTPKAQSDRYRIHVIDRAAQILDCCGFDHQELRVSGADPRLHRSHGGRDQRSRPVGASIESKDSHGWQALGQDSGRNL